MKNTSIECQVWHIKSTCVESPNHKSCLVDHCLNIISAKLFYAFTFQFFEQDLPLSDSPLFVQPNLNHWGLEATEWVSDIILRKHRKVWLCMTRAYCLDVIFTSHVDMHYNYEFLICYVHTFISKCLFDWENGSVLYICFSSLKSMQGQIIISKFSSDCIRC